MSLRNRLLLTLEREDILIVLLGTVWLVMMSRLWAQVLPDSWLTLLGGRELVQHGLPHVNQWTIWAQGKHWVDQQWLAQLIFYGLYRLGGLKLALLVHSLLSLLVPAFAMLLARQRGAAVKAVALVGTLAVVTLAASWQLRAQTLALALFMLTLWLLLRDARSPSRRLFLIVPILMLWANLHGSCILGAAAALVYCFDLHKRGQTQRAALLALSSVAALFASPYALALPGYYHHILFNPSFATVIIEWAPTTLGIITLPFFLLLLLAAILAGQRALSRFELLLLAVFALLGLAALRNVIWFVLLCLVVLPAPLSRLWSQWRPQGKDEVPATARRAVAAAVLVVALAATVVALWRPISWYEQGYPRAAATAVAKAAASHPQVPVLANERYADWLLWEQPELRGRVVFDGRLELWQSSQLQDLYVWNNGFGGPYLAGVARDAIVILPRHNAPALKKLLAQGQRPLYEDSHLAVFERGAASGH